MGLKGECGEGLEGEKNIYINELDRVQSVLRETELNPKKMERGGKAGKNDGAERFENVWSGIVVKSGQKLSE